VFFWVVGSCSSKASNNCTFNQLTSYTFNMYNCGEIECLLAYQEPDHIPIYGVRCRWQLSTTAVHQVPDCTGTTCVWP
jgi:hypothetical protein